MLTYDDRLSSQTVIGQAGYTEIELPELWSQLKPLVDQLTTGQLPTPGFGFISLPTDTAMLQTVTRLAREVAAEYDTLLVLGIGGSDLGARAVSQAILHPFHNNLARTDRPGLRLFFAGANTDPRELSMVMSQLDWSKTAINVISKSGQTLETMASFMVCLEALEQAVGRDQAMRHIIATTGATGTLHDLAQREGYRTLPVPNDISGRFSVLSAVGLFPLACAGVDIAALLSGAGTMVKRLAEGSERHPAVCHALLHANGYQKHGQTMAVFMPYAESLRQLGFWQRQLWAESLGKQKNLAGQDVYLGQTPIAALGATDQHSQIQLYIEGPFDKLITFVVTDTPRSKLDVPSRFPDYEHLKVIGGTSMYHLLSVEQTATAAALAAHGRPTATIHLEIINEEHIGELMMMLMLSATFMGQLLQIDPFDQPGVEHGKVNMEQILAGQASPELAAFL